MCCAGAGGLFPDTPIIRGGVGSTPPTSTKAAAAAGLLASPGQAGSAKMGAAAQVGVLECVLTRARTQANYR
jgi:hypothetical protein